MKKTADEILDELLKKYDMVTRPLITEAMRQFAAQEVAEIINSDKPIQITVNGNDLMRLGELMNWKDHKDDEEKRKGDRLTKEMATTINRLHENINHGAPYVYRPEDDPNRPYVVVDNVKDVVI